jgi:quinol monooxygenase YgiN
MERSGLADAIRAENGNLQYRSFVPTDDPEAVLPIDSWADQAAIDAHHQSPMMRQIAALREQYDLHMEAKRFISMDVPQSDEQFLRK